MAKVLVQLSGGLDSAAALIEAGRRYRFDNLFPVFFDYGQPYLDQELEAAHNFSSFYSLHLAVHKIELLTGASFSCVPEYVPMRNLALASLSINIAYSIAASVIVVGNKTVEHREGDPYSFKDCTRSFFESIEKAVSVGKEEQAPNISFLMPLAGWNKKDVISTIISVGFRYQDLWSCYRGDSKKMPCGKCFHCEEVRKAEEQLRGSI